MDATAGTCNGVETAAGAAALPVLSARSEIPSPTARAAAAVIVTG